MQHALWKMALCFVISALSAQWWPILPSLDLCAFAILIALLFIALFPTTNNISCIIGLLFGALWMASVGHSYQSWQLPKQKIKQNVIIEGRVIEAKSLAHIQKLVVDVTLFERQPTSFRVKINSYYLAKRFQKHQKVRLEVRLKPVHGLQNPGGFDYWRWLVSQRIQATGYIVQSDNNVLLIPANTIQSLLLYRLEKTGDVSIKWLKAMLFADRSELNDNDWQLLQRTGIAHLFTLSGLHMGIVYWLCIWFSKLTVFVLSTLTRIQLSLAYTPVIHCLSLTMAWGFVALCDYPLTLIRAAVALTLYVCVLARNQSLFPFAGILLVLMLCLLISPLSSLGLSLYLSFFAVMSLLFLTWRFSSKLDSIWSKVKYVITLQFALSSFMMLATGSVFHAIHWSSFVINLIAIPFVSIVIVPLGCVTLLLLLVIPSAGESLATLLSIILNRFIYFLEYVPTYSNSIHLNAVYWGVIGAGLIIMMLPAIKYRLIGLCAVGAIILFKITLFNMNYKKTRDWTIHIFDVGQGSALLIESGDQAMLVDTGPAFKGRTSSAESVIVPTLKQLGIHTPLNGVITHRDNDHAGGQQWLSSNHVVTEWRSPQKGCVKGQQWQLNTLTVDVLWPPPNWQTNNQLSKNNHSCVLLISDGNTRLLIPGDIEKKAEQRLIKENVDMRADILIAPHHGSKTSSTAQWINRVSPKFVVATTGYYNRWNFPDDYVVSRYKAIGSTVLSTAEAGYIRFSISSSLEQKSHIHLQTWQHNLNRRWYKSR